MLRKARLLAFLQFFLLFFLFFNLSIAQEAMNISQNSSTDGNFSVSETTSTTLASELAAVENLSTESTVQGMNLSSTSTTSETLTTTTSTLVFQSERKPNISVEVKTREKITRGESFSLFVSLKNVGNATAKNVNFEIKLPAGFSTSEQKIDCGDLEVNSSCEKEIEVFSSLNTELGKNQIEVVVSYA